MNKVIHNDLAELCVRNPDLSVLRGMTVMITGASGLIAKYLTFFLLFLNSQRDMGMKVVAMVRNLGKAEKIFAEYLGRDDFVLVRQDVCDEITYEGSADYIIHAASSANPRSIISDPVGIIKANTIGTFNVMEYARSKEVRKVLFTSTREIYGSTSDDIDAVSESDTGQLDSLDPRSCYPESKRAAESILQSYRTQYGIEFSIVRIAHTYGPLMDVDNDGRVMSDFIGDTINGRDIVLNSDGTAERAFCYVSDTADGILKVLLKGEGGCAYNLANETEPHPIKEIAELLAGMYPQKNIKVILNTDSRFSAGGYSRYRRVMLDTSRLESLGWKPEISLADGLRRTVESFGGQ